MRDDRGDSNVRFESNVQRTGTDHAPEMIDAILDALADEDRRTVVRQILGRPGWTGLDELADRIHARGGVTGSGLDDSERIRCRLYHAHLPKLDDADIVEFDRTQNTVRQSADDRRLDLCLDLMDHAGR